MSSDVRFTTENIDQYMKALAKAYKKLGGRSTPAEIILIGGAAVLTDYGFREATYDIDAIITASSVMKDAMSEQVRMAVSDLIERTRQFPNFVLSTGCDVPPQTPLHNIDAFFQALNA